MSEDKKSLIDLVPDSVDNAVKNITDKPTQNIGTTFADIWYLVFGGISQAAEKRKLKYSYALQEFEKELKEKISKIPEDKLIEPDMQTVAPALEASKYCIEKEELRHMFAKLISNSLSCDTSDKVHPIFSHIISSLTPTDVKILIDLNEEHKIDIINSKYINIIFSLYTLLQLGLIYFEQENHNENISLEAINTGELRIKYKPTFSNSSLSNITITPLGNDFLAVCT